MTVFRAMTLALFLGLLTACDEPPKPALPAAMPQPEAPAPASPAEVAPPAKAALQPPVTAPEPVAPTRAAPPDKAPAVASSKPRGAETPATRPRPKEEALPPVQLDLRLPDELVQRLEPGVPLEVAEQPLLPALFVEKPAELSPYQLNGRLITNDQVDDYWDSVEGAELQIEFRN
jgi:hypothetical protein